MAASSQGGGHQRSLSPEEHREGQVVHAPNVGLGPPRALMHGGASRSTCVTRGTGRKVALPVG